MSLRHRLIRVLITRICQQRLQKFRRLQQKVSVLVRIIVLEAPRPVTIFIIWPIFSQRSSTLGSKI